MKNNLATLILLTSLLLFTNVKADYTNLKQQAIARYGLLSQVPKAHAVRKGSWPYLCPDTFRNMADHIFDETDAPFSPSAIKRGDVVYVSRRFFDVFFTHLHKLIKNSYILISGNYYQSSPRNFAYLLNDPKILHWFSVNGDIVNHSKFTHIPLGLANPYWKHGNSDTIRQVQKEQESEQLEKKYLVNLNFDIGSSNDRKGIFSYFKQKTFVTLTPRKSHKEYLQDLALSKFVISPPGRALDCHRTWEALLVGCIPILFKSTLDLLYADLPVVIVGNWHNVSAEFLEKEYARIHNHSFQLEKLYAPYWKQKIKNLQENLLKNE